MSNSFKPATSIAAVLLFLQWSFASSVVLAEVLSVRDADMQLMRGVEDQAHIGLELLGKLKESDSPEEILLRIDQYFLEVQSGKELPHDEWNEAYAPLGALWGEQIGRSYGWKWVKVWLDENEGEFRYAVTSPDKAMVIYPFVHMKACVEEGATVSIARIYQVIGSSRRLLEIPSESYTDILADPSLMILAP